MACELCHRKEKEYTLCDACFEMIVRLHEVWKNLGVEHKFNLTRPRRDPDKEPEYVKRQRSS